MRRPRRTEFRNRLGRADLHSHKSTPPSLLWIESPSRDRLIACRTIPRYRRETTALRSCETSQNRFASFGRQELKDCRETTFRLRRVSPVHLRLCDLSSRGHCRNTPPLAAFHRNCRQYISHRLCETQANRKHRYSYLPHS